MRDQSVFQGKILLGKKPLMKFEVEIPHHVGLQKTLMNSFRGLNLTESEKRIFTRKLRERVYCYQSLNPQTLKKYADQLVKKIAHANKSKMTINASEYGSFICLAAILSGKLPHDVNIVFNLSAVPMVLFPRELIRKRANGQECDLRLSMEKDHWLRPFKSLHKAPKQMGIESQTDLRDIAESPSLLVA